MKVALVAVLLVASAFSKAQTTVLPAACGSPNVSFKVKLNYSQHTMAQPEAGKAQVYFIQDEGPIDNRQHYTLKIGLDGAWVGAYKTNSWFSVPLEPGEHHVCAAVQSNSDFGNIVALAHVVAEPGKSYFFHTRFLAGIPSSVPPYLVLDPVDSDEAKYLIAAFPLSVSHPNK